MGGEEFAEASPFARIPALRDGDFLLSDSSAIATYFEAIRPDPQLIPDDPKAKAKTVWFDEFSDTILIGTFVKMFFHRVVGKALGRPVDEAIAAQAEADELPQVLGYLEKMVTDSGFLIGDRLTLADISVVSPFANLAHCCTSDWPVQFPGLKAYVDGIMARPSFAAILAAEEPAMKHLLAA